MIQDGLSLLDHVALRLGRWDTERVHDEIYMLAVELGYGLLPARLIRGILSRQLAEPGDLTPHHAGGGITDEQLQVRLGRPV